MAITGSENGEECGVVVDVVCAAVERNAVVDDDDDGADVKEDVMEKLEMVGVAAWVEELEVESVVDDDGAHVCSAAEH